MGNFSDRIIRDVDNIQFSNNIVTNVHCIKEVTTEESNWWFNHKFLCRYRWL